MATAAAAWLLNYHCDCVGMVSSRGRVGGGGAAAGGAGRGVAAPRGARVRRGHIMRSAPRRATAGGAATTAAASQAIEEAGNVFQFVAQNPPDPIAQSLPSEETGARSIVARVARGAIRSSG